MSTSARPVRPREHYGARNLAIFGLAIATFIVVGIAYVWSNPLAITRATRALGLHGHCLSPTATTDGIVRCCDVGWTNPHLVPKGDGNYRFTCDPLLRIFGEQHAAW